MVNPTPPQGRLTLITTKLVITLPATLLATICSHFRESSSPLRLAEASLTFNSLATPITGMIYRRYFNPRLSYSRTVYHLKKKLGDQFRC